LETEIQPLESDRWIVLWNGEVYTVDQCMFSGMESDSRLVLNLLDKAPQEKDIDTYLIDLFSRKIKAEFAFILYDKIYQQLYYSRDVIGRRSLLQKNLAVSSILVTGEEVSTKGIHSIDLNTMSQRLIQWKQEWLDQLFKFNREIMEQNYDAVIQSEEYAQALQTTYEIMKRSLKERTVTFDSSSPISVLFSGGLDSTAVAAMLHFVLDENVEIDLLNVAFENPRFVKNNKVDDIYQVPDRITGIASFNELRSVYPNRKWRFVKIDVPVEDSSKERPHVVDLLKPSNTVMDLSIGIALWFLSRGKGKALKTCLFKVLIMKLVKNISLHPKFYFQD
jgi:asparagine synthetase B (glutamine-hydrolysing)